MTQPDLGLVGWLVMQWVGIFQDVWRCFIVIFPSIYIDIPKKGLFHDHLQLGNQKPGAEISLESSWAICILPKKGLQPATWPVFLGGFKVLQGCVHAVFFGG